jgi:hypothetical protein
MLISRKSIMTSAVQVMIMKDGKMEKTHVPQPAPVQDAVGAVRATLPIRNTAPDLT